MSEVLDLPASRLIRIAQWLMVVMAFAIPMQVAVNNLVLGVLLLTALPAVGKQIPDFVHNHPVARAALLLFGFLALGTLWGETPWGQAVGILGKYVDLALIPIFMLLLRRQPIRERALWAFFAVMMLVLALSWSLWLGLLPLYKQVQFLVGPSAHRGDPSIFHSHITQGMLTAFACFLFALKAREVRSFPRILLFGLSILAGANVLFLLKGGTGYLVLATLLACLAWIIFSDWMAERGKKTGWRHILAVTLLLILALATAWKTVPQFHDRVAMSISDTRMWRPGQQHGDSSVAHRLDFYLNTLHLIGARPVTGYGTGGFGSAFAKQTAETSIVPTNNPHNEYLMLAAQVGLGGPMLLLFLFITQWRQSTRLPAFERRAGRGLVLTYALSCMLNSMLLDHTEGLFFAFMTALLFARLGGDTPEPEVRALS